jgi:hypothetical protein
VRLVAPVGVGPNNADGIAEGFQVDLFMAAVPRVDETIALGEEDSEEERTYRVHGVHWYPEADGFDVYIVLRD